MRKLAVLLGCVESLGLLMYSLAVGMSQTHGATHVGQNVHLIQAVIYLIFASIIGFVSWGIHQGKSLARTPYYLFQIFTLIASRLLTASTNERISALGIVIVVIAIVGMVALYLDGRTRPAV